VRRPADVARRVVACALGAVALVLFAAGTRAFATVVTTSFSSAGFAIVPLGMFIVGILLIPLMSAVHGFWIAGSPELRAAEAARDARDEAKVRLAAGEARRAAALRRGE
jgi:CHASE2 domain-containing sensor protein